MTVRGAIAGLLDEAHIEDFIYDVRSRAAESAPAGYAGSTWDLPAVVRYSDACATLRQYLTVDRAYRAKSGKPAKKLGK